MTPKNKDSNAKKFIPKQQKNAKTVMSKVADTGATPLNEGPIGGPQGVERDPVDPGCTNVNYDKTLSMLPETTTLVDTPEYKKEHISPYPPESKPCKCPTQSIAAAREQARNPNR